MKGWKLFNFDEVEIKENAWVGVNTPENTRKKRPSDILPKSNIPSKQPCIQPLNSKSFNFFDLIAPKSIEELAVHPKKISDIEDWIVANVTRPRAKSKSSFLLLTGPTGCAKTEALKCLCKNKSVGISEWLNPIHWQPFSMDSRKHYENYVNDITQFTEFIIESSYGSLLSPGRNICMVKEFPNALIRNPEEFSTVLEEVSDATNVCAIFIVTEDGTASSIERKLFTDELKAKFNIESISFNPCTTRLLKKAVVRAQKLVQSQSSVFNVLSDNIIEAICAASGGDVRCSLNEYYLAALKGSNFISLDEKVINETKTGVKRKRPTKSLSLKIKLKDEILGLFHSVGRVLHPKIDPETKKIHHNIESLVEEFSSQPSAFLGFLHENYIRYFGDIQDAMHASTYLSLARAIMDKWTEQRDSYVIGLYIAVMGLMLHNKHRVSMWNPIKGPVKIKQEPVVRTQHLRVVDPTDVCYYNMLEKRSKFNRFHGIK